METSTRLGRSARQTEAAGAPTLAAREIAKSFGATRAVRGVSVAFRGGSIHAVIGENGAGKSTLTHMLSGAITADAGSILIDGAVAVLRTPLEAQAQGIRMVHQHDTLVPNLSVTENILLGLMPRRRLGSLDWPAAHARARAILGDLGYPRLGVRAPASELSAAQRQIVEIAKAVAAPPRVLILDEPTASLTQGDAERLFVFLRALRDRGVAIIYISHRLDEVLALADYVTVLRDGLVTGSLPAGEADKPTLIRLMVGRAIAELVPRQRAAAGRPLISVQGLSRAPAVHDVSFEVGAGEIVGLYGLIGSGRSRTSTPSLMRPDSQVRGSMGIINVDQATTLISLIKISLILV